MKQSPVRILFAAAFLALAAIPRPAAATQFLVNGNLETWTSATDAASWTEIGTVTRDATESSPFTDIYPIGTSSAIVAAGTGNGLLQNFTSQTGVVQATLDFKYDTLPTNGQVYHWSIDNSALTAFRLSIGASFGKYTANTTGIVNILPLSAGTWYQVFVNVDVPNQVINGGIRPYGANSYTLFSQAFSAAAPNVNRFASPISGFVTGTAPDQPLTFDNMSLTDELILPPPPVPEPSTLALLGMGLGCVALRLRRQRV